MDRTAPALAPALMALGRLLISVIFLWDGAGLIAAPGPSIAYIATSALPFPTIAYAGAVAVQLLGGAALLVGWRARWAAAALAAFCVATALFFHDDFANLDMEIHFFKNLAMAGGLLQIVAAGGGAWSLDGRRSKR